VRSVLGLLALVLAILGVVTLFAGAFVGMAGWELFASDTIYMLIGIGAAATVLGLAGLLWVSHREQRDTDRRTDW
jgi:hypothetical protein